MAGYDWSKQQRQPKAAILVVFYRVVLGLIKVLWPLLLIWLLIPAKVNSEKREILITVLSGMTLFFSLIEYWYLRYSIPANELIVKRGLFVKRNLTLPLEKIQAVHIEQDWLHRLLNLSQVSFDSPGSKNAEVKLTMRTSAAEALRNFIIGTGKSISEPAEEIQKRPFFRMEPFDLVKLGLSANHLEAFFIILAFGLSVMDDLETVLGQQYEGALKWLSDQAAESSGNALLLLLVTGLVISVIVSFIRIVLRYANFRISKTSKGFYIQSGLINTREKIVPFNKVQYVSWRANWIRKYIPYYLLQFHSIGVRETMRKWELTVPVTRVELLPQLLFDYMQAIPSDSPFMKIHPAYVWRRTLMAGILPATILATPGYFVFDPSMAWFLLLIPYTLLSSWLFMKNFRLYISADALQVYRAIFGREEIMLKWDKIQSVRIRRSIYQRRKGLASVVLYTAGGVIRIPFIKRSQAEQICDYALFKVESGNENWI